MRVLADLVVLAHVVFIVFVLFRAARAAALTTYQIRQYQLARRAAGAATGTINRETSALHRMCTLAVHWGWLDTVPGFPDRLRENRAAPFYWRRIDWIDPEANGSTAGSLSSTIAVVVPRLGWRRTSLL